MSKSKRASLAVLGGVLAVSFSGPLIKMALADAVPPVIIAFYRLMITTLLILPITLGKEKYRKELQLLKKKDIFILLCSGVFLALHFITWITSLKYTTTFGSTVLVCTQPLFVVVGAYILFKERISGISALGGLVALIGMIMIGVTDFSGGHESLWGDMLALSGAMFIAAYFLCGREIRSRLSMFPYTLVVYGVCAFVLFMVALYRHIPFFPYSLKSIAIFFALSVLCTLFGHSVFNWAMEYIKASVISVAILGEPVGAALWAFLFFNEVPGPFGLVGGILILIGVVFFVLNEGDLIHIKWQKRKGSLVKRNIS